MLAPASRCNDPSRARDASTAVRAWPASAVQSYLSLTLACLGMRDPARSYPAVPGRLSFPEAANRPRGGAGLTKQTQSRSGWTSVAGARLAMWQYVLCSLYFGTLHRMLLSWIHDQEGDRWQIGRDRHR